MIVNGKGDSYVFLQGFILVFDVTKEQSFYNINKWLTTIDKVMATVYG